MPLTKQQEQDRLAASKDLAWDWFIAQVVHHKASVSATLTEVNRRFGLAEMVSCELRIELLLKENP